MMMRSRDTVLILVTAVYAIVLAVTNQLVNEQVHDAYMDEPFHFNQTKLYCQHIFNQWDNKITTLPGLYAASFIIHITCQFIIQLLIASFNALGLSSSSITDFDSCSLFALRNYNVLYSTGSLVMMIQLIHSRLQASQQRSESFILPIVLAAIRLSLLPFSVFFASLYYTDSLSTMCVLAVICSAQSDESRVRALTGQQWMRLFICFFAIFVRQTNVIWIAFAVALQLTNRYDHSNPGDSLIQSIPKFARHCLASFDVVMSISWPYLVSLIGFVVFVLINGSIVVGDKSNHSMTMHLTFPLYMAAMTAAMSLLSICIRSPSGDSDISAYISQWKRSPFINLVVIVLLTLIVRSFTLSHPFLLADNRHVTFYLWRYLLSRPIKFALVPVYHFSLWWMNHFLSLTIKPILQITYFLCVALALIPTPLIEPRYCIMPIIVFHILISNRYLKETTGASVSTTRQSLAWLLEAVAFAVVHVAVLYVFLYKPYTWGDGSTARHMW